jgi:hypothetical protein
MPKRSVKAYRPTGIQLDENYVRSEHIDSLTAIAGPLPDLKFEIEQPGGQGEECVRLQVPAREYLGHHLETAVGAFRLEMQQGKKPTPAQLASEYDVIEKAALRLLGTLQVSKAGDFERMPLALRFGGLSAQARIDAQERGTSENRPLDGDSLLRQTVEGVRDLRRWAAAARERELRIHSALPRSQRRYEGNPALNSFLQYVVANAWWAIWGLEIKDSLPLCRFIAATAAIVDVSLSEDGARQKLRSIFADTFAKRRTAKSR